MIYTMKMRKLSRTKERKRRTSNNKVLYYFVFFFFLKAIHGKYFLVFSQWSEDKKWIHTLFRFCCFLFYNKLVYRCDGHSVRNNSITHQLFSFRTNYSKPRIPGKVHFPAVGKEKRKQLWLPFLWSKPRVTMKYFIHFYFLKNLACSLENAM